jgi:hypothetical protein
MRFPAISGRSASCQAAQTLAPADIPQAIPSGQGTRRCQGIFCGTANDFVNDELYLSISGQGRTTNSLNPMWPWLVAIQEQLFH